MKVFLDSVGCRLNQSELESYARQFRSAGHELVSAPELAELAVINTCSVTSAAASDSRQKIRQSARAGAQQVVVTGCWSTLEPQAAAALPAVSQVVPNQDKDELVLRVLNTPVLADEAPNSQPRPENMRTRAFIKVQDGCDNRCTFCVTTIARGVSRSRPIPAVLQDIQAALAGGAQEIVLTGVHLGAWGQDFSPPAHLRTLVQAILLETDAPRLRLSSLEPWDLDENFFQLWLHASAAGTARLCRHLHLPLQSGCTATLRRMARKTTPAAFRHLAQTARQVIPGLALTTDVIVGFPGETHAEFAESLAFVEEMAFSGGHVFSYSPRAGTAASRMPGRVGRPDTQARSQQMRSVIERSAAAYRAAFVGAQLDVLWEGGAVPLSGGWQINGLTDNYLRVQANASRRLWNVISPVRLEALGEGEVLCGRLLQAQGMESHA